MPPRKPEPEVEPAPAGQGASTGVWRLMLVPRTVIAALKVALVVGMALNVINNGEQFWVHHSVNLWQVALNFIVPYCVSSYSAARNEAQRARGV